MSRNITNIEEMLDAVAAAAEENERVSLGDMVDAFGHRCLGPPLLLVGLAIASPLSGIPGLPTIMAILVVLMIGQFIAGRKELWLPAWLRRCSIEKAKVATALKWLRKPAGFIDRFLKPRLTGLVHRIGSLGIAFICLLIAFAMPLLELIPFSSSVAGSAMAIFGLSLVAQDGLLALIAITLAGALMGLIIYNLLA